MKIIGHRGAKGLAPENTVISMLKAIEHRVDEIEFDLRVTKDNVVILQHDPELRDPAGNELSVCESTFDELKAHKADLATFEEAMYAINRRVPVLIEVKPAVVTKPIISEVERLLEDGWTEKDMLFGSFSQSTLIELHEALPTIPIVVIERWSGIRATYRAKRLGTKRLNMSHRWLWRGFIAPMSRRGWQLYPYTLNDTTKATRWKRYGIAGIITDYPDRFEK